MRVSALPPVALAGAVAVVATVVFWPVLQNGFVWDDLGLYLTQPALRDTSSFFAGTLATVSPGLHYFRPVALATFKLQFLLFGDSTVAAHAIGLALHAANSFLVASLAARLPGTTPARVALAGVLYALHPVLVEPVSWMSCRFDLLVALWLLLALHADAALHSAVGRAATVASLYFLALCSKEMAAPFPAVLAVFQLATRYRDVRWADLPRQLLARDGLTYAALVLALGAYVALRATFVGGAVDADPDVLAELTGFGDRAALVASTLLFHLRHVVLPFDDLNPLHPLDLDALAFGPRDLATLALVGVLLAALGIGVARRSPAATLVAAFVVALLPVLNLVPVTNGNNIGHERYLTFPLCLVALALAAVPLPARAPMRRVAVAGAALTSLLWCGLCVANIRLTIPLWRTEVSLFGWAYAKHPGSDYAFFALVTSLLDAGRADTVAKLFEEPRPATLGRSQTRFFYARYLLERGQAVEGERQLRLAIQEFPQWYAAPPADERGRRDFATYRGNLGIAYALLADLELDEAHYDRALESASIAGYYDPGLARAGMSYALALYAHDDPESGGAMASNAVKAAGDADRARLARRRDEFLSQLCAREGAHLRRSCAARRAR